MRFPFYYKTSLRTQLSQQQIEDILSTNTITENGKSAKDKRVVEWNEQQFSETGENFLYNAKFGVGRFKLYRILEGPVGGKPRNSFNPLCFGRIYDMGGERVIELTFRSAIFVFIFMFIWTSGGLFGTFGIIISSLQKAKYQDALLTPIILSPFYLRCGSFTSLVSKRRLSRH